MSPCPHFSDPLQQSIRIVLRLLGRLCETAEREASGDAGSDADPTLMSAAGQGGSGSLDAVLLACLRLVLAMRLEEPVALMEQAAQLPLKRNLQRALLGEVCRANGVSKLREKII